MNAGNETTKQQMGVNHYSSSLRAKEKLLDWSLILLTNEEIYVIFKKPKKEDSSHPKENIVKSE